MTLGVFSGNFMGRRKMDTISKGEKTLLLTLAALITTRLLCGLYLTLRDGSNRILELMPNYLLLCLLCYFIYRRSKVAKIIFIIFSGLLAVVSIMSFLGAFSIYAVDWVGFIAYWVAAFIIIKNKNVKGYMLYERENK